MRINFLPGQAKTGAKQTSAAANIPSASRTNNKPARRRGFAIVTCLPRNPSKQPCFPKNAAYLLVLDKNLRIVGMVRMRDLMLGDEDRPHSGG
jgi:hypothetical protein